MDKQQEHLLRQNKTPKALQTNDNHCQDTNKALMDAKGIDGDSGILENVKETIQDTFTPVRKRTMITLAGDYDGWHYGLKYELSPSLLMTGVMETLVELNTVLFLTYVEIYNEL